PKRSPEISRIFPPRPAELCPFVPGLGSCKTRQILVSACLATVRALSSAGERSLHTGEVIGSIPIAPTIQATSSVPPVASLQQLAESIPPVTPIGVAAFRKSWPF